MGSDGIRGPRCHHNVSVASAKAHFVCGILTGSDGIRKAIYRKIVLSPKASRKLGLRRGRIRRGPHLMILLNFAFRVKLAAIYEWDPCGIRAGSNGIRRDLGEVLLLKFARRLELVDICGQDPCGIRAGPSGIQRDPS